MTKLVLGIASIALFLAAWEVIARTGLAPAGLFPSPGAVADAAWTDIQDGSLQNDFYWSTWRALLGFAWGSVAGVFVGLLTGRVRFIQFLLEPPLQLMRPIPALAWLPLTILWLGVGEGQKVFLIGFGVFFVLWLQTHLGVGKQPPHYLEVARTLGYSEKRIFFSVVLPATMPHIAIGLRQGITIAITLLVASELAGASNGLGYLIATSRVVFRSDEMFVGIICLGILGASVDYLMGRLLAKFVHWS